jgi:hypothetical protein
MNLDVFPEFSAAISTCIDLNSDYSLTAWRDLPRVRGNRAASAGFDPFNFERCGSLVLDNKFMVHYGAFHNRRKIVLLG